MELNLGTWPSRSEYPKSARVDLVDDLEDDEARKFSQ